MRDKLLHILHRQARLDAEDETEMRQIRDGREIFHRIKGHLVNGGVHHQRAGGNDAENVTIWPCLGNIVGADVAVSTRFVFNGEGLPQRLA